MNSLKVVGSFLCTILRYVCLRTDFKFSIKCEEQGLRALLIEEALELEMSHGISDHWKDVNSWTCWLEENVFEAAGFETLISNGRVRESRALGQSIGQGFMEVHLILFTPGDHLLWVGEV